MIAPSWPTQPERAAHPTTGSRLVAAGDLIGFLALHGAVLAVFWVGVSSTALALCVVTYTVRCWAVSAGFHRYFSHRSFETSRPMQFLIALVGTTAMQKGVLWWASTHRRHHRYADTPLDPHSPQHRSFLYSHCGWVFDPAHQRYDRRIVADLERFAELVWLERLKLVPVAALGAGLWFAAGTRGFVCGFCVSTVALWHTTLSTGSFSHRIGGYRNFDISDDSRNNRVIALLLLGEGWHNNHHRAPNSARHSTGRHEPDPIYASLRLLASLRLVWSIRDRLPRPASEPG
jgi:stearoyl-CoA desaturase (delta-9 desaturase)